MGNKLGKPLLFFTVLLVAISVYASSIFAQPGLSNFRWVGSTGLALCGQPETTAEWTTIRNSYGITADVNLRVEYQDPTSTLSSLGIAYYYLPITNNTDIYWDVSSQQVNTAVHWINNRLDEGKKVLIHCYYGQGRAPTMASMWYVHEGHTADQALTWIQQYPELWIAPQQEQAIRNYYTWVLQNPDPSETSSGIQVDWFLVGTVLAASIALFYVWRMK